MRVLFCLLLMGVAFSLRREAAGQTPEPSENNAVVRAGNQFALDLYAQLDREQPGKNLFFSPTSISLALAMTAAGARGQTQAEMAKVLHLDGDLAQAHAHYHKLLEQWNAVGQKRAYQLRVANRLWGQKGYAIRPEFLALTRQQYGAEMLLLDFAQAEPASREINQWVEQQTNDKIKDLIPAGAIDALTRLVLTNAVYFKGDWVQPFDKKNTRDEDFTVSAQEKVKVPLMHQKTTTGLRRGGDASRRWRCPTRAGSCRWSCCCRRRRTGCRSWRRRSRSISSPRCCRSSTSARSTPTCPSSSWRLPSV